jgi:hypothetical protein
VDVETRGLANNADVLSLSDGHMSGDDRGSTVDANANTFSGCQFPSVSTADVRSLSDGRKSGDDRGSTVDASAAIGNMTKSNHKHGQVEPINLVQNRTSANSDPRDTLNSKKGDKKVRCLT